jgi:Family of unknown function (DUF5677)
MNDSTEPERQSYDSLAQLGPSWLGDGERQAVLLGPHMVGSTLNSISSDTVASLRRAADVYVFMEAMHRRDGHNAVVHEAMSAFVNNVLNDWVDLVFDCLQGRGRTALRTARSLFESSLVAGELVSDEALCKRYLDHIPVTAMNLLRSDPTVELRRKKRFRQAAHLRRKGLLEWTSQEEQVIAAYGKDFRSRWDSKTTYARAEAAGRSDEYFGFRAASATVHATSGALFGTLATYENEVRVHRVGLNIAAAPLALAYGMKSFEVIVSALRPFAGEATDAMLDRLSEVRDAWSDFEQCMAEIDLWIWPSETPHHLQLVAVITPASTWSYWLCNSEEDGMVIEATLSAPDKPKADSRVRELVEQLNRHYQKRDAPQTIGLSPLRAVPKKGANWRAMGDVFPALKKIPAMPMPGFVSVGANNMRFEFDPTKPLGFRRIDS